MQADNKIKQLVQKKKKWGKEQVRKKSQKRVK